MSLKYIINEDLKRLPNSECGGLKLFLKWYIFPNCTTFRHIVWFRILQNCKKNPILKYSIGLLVYKIEEHYSIKYGIQINSNSSVGEGLYVVHGGTVFLNCRSIGKNVTIYPGVMLGNSRGEIPIVEDNVKVYTGAVIAGNIRLGNGCVIGANSVVMDDCEPGYLYAGVPAKKIKKLT